MRRDLIIGSVFSLAVIVGTAWISELTKGGPPKVRHKEEDTIPLIPIPKIEPDQPEVDDEEKPAPVDFAPPQIADVPQVITDTSFVQPLQPPPPDNIKIAKGQIVIPEQGSGWAKGIRIFDLNELDQIPVETFTVTPNYPPDMRRFSIAGEVVVDFIVDTNGDVHDAYAFSSTQHEFEANAVLAVSKWRFKPGKSGGHSVVTHMQVPIQFTLNDGE